MASPDGIQQRFLLFPKVPRRSRFLGNAHQKSFHKGGYRNISLGGNDSRPAIGFIVQCDGDVFHGFTVLQFHRVTI